MRLRHLGYACQNVTLGCTTGRTFRLASLNDARAAETIRENLAALGRTLEWNVQNGIRFFRISSDVVPFASHERFTLDWRRAFESQLRSVRTYVREHRLRLTMHPGQYTVLNSPRPDVVEAALRELEYHAAFIHLVDPESGTMTLHVGGGYGDKRAALERFMQNANRLSELARSKLTVENDDKVFHVDDVLHVCEPLGIPAVFDYFHHLCYHPGRTPDEGLTEQIERVVATWEGRVPKFHLSSRKPGTKTSHADYVAPEDFSVFVDLMDGIGGDEPYDLMLEAKQKDRALLRLRETEMVS